MDITTHAAVRNGQRGFRETDLEFIARAGSMIPAAAGMCA